MIHKLMWIVTAASVIGAVLNAQKRRVCFYIWAATNVLWIAYDIYISAYAQAGLFLVYLCICIYGIIKWRR